jgi:hypothetical protein
MPHADAEYDKTLYGLDSSLLRGYPESRFEALQNLN